MFRRGINPYSVSDKATFVNVDKKLTLYVRADAGMLVNNLRKANEKLVKITDETSECEKVNAARFFARAVFGEEQGDRLLDFYHDPVIVIKAVGAYFNKYLKNKITKVQKK